MKILQILLALILSCQLYATDKSTIKGWVQSTEGETVSFATALIFSAQDSSLIKADIALFDGVIDIWDMDSGTYFMKVLLPGFEAYSTDNFTLVDYREYVLPVIILKKKSSNTAWLEEFEGLQLQNGSNPKSLIM